MSRNKKKRNKIKRRLEKETQNNMTAVVITNERPGFFKAVSPTGSDISKMGKILFYFRGVDDVVFMKVDGTKYDVNIPPTSGVTNKEVTQRVKAALNEVLDDKADLHIADHVWFAVDLFTKKILTPKSFVDFIPAYNIQKCLFIEEGGSIIHSLLDMTDYTALQASALFIAKRYCIKPKEGDEWTTSGKMLLSYIVSKEYAKPGRFVGLNGVWDHVIWRFENDKSTPYYSLQDYKTTRAMDLASKINVVWDADVISTTPMTGVVVKGDRNVFLSEIVAEGAMMFMRHRTGLYEVEVDIMRETFSQVRINCSSNTFLVRLEDSCSYTLDELEDALNADHVSLMDDKSLEIVKRNLEVSMKGGH